MARGGRVIYKKTNRGPRRKLGFDEDDDDGDEEYVVEKEEEESSYESDAPSSDEASYEFSDEVEEEEGEEEETKISRSRGSRKKRRVSDDELEDLSVAKKGRPISRKRREARASDYEVEEEETELPRPRENWKNSRVLDDEMEDVPVVKKGRLRSEREAMDPDYEMEDEEEDDNFLPDEDEWEEDEVPPASKRRGVKNIGKMTISRVSRPKGKLGSKREARDSDYEMEDEEEDDNFSPDEDEWEEDEVPSASKRRGVKNVGKMARSRVSRPKGRKKWKVAEPAGRKRLRESALSPDDDFVVKDRVSVWRRKKFGRGNTANTDKSKSKKKAPAVDSDSLESVFATSDDDFVLEEDQVMVNRRKSSGKSKKTVGSRERRKKRSDVDSRSSDSDYVISDDDEDEFMGRDQVLVDKQRKKDKMKQPARSKTRRKMSSANLSDSDYKILEDDVFTVREQILVDNKKEKLKEAGFKTRRKRFSVESESSDSDYLISEEDDFMFENKLAVIKQQKNKKGGKKNTEPSTRRKRPSMVSDSNDCNDHVNFEEEVRDLRLRGGLNQQQQQLGQLVVSRPKEEKGKEKEASELGKQVCGICLSEEQKGVVQGFLNCCSHYFCFACIMEWSKVESRCPVCKRRFVTITKSGRSDPGFGMRKAVIRVEKRDQVYHPSEEELRNMLDPYETVVCIECQQGGDDNLMLLCDICDSSAHTYCVGLGREVPEGNWYCGGCKSTGDGQMLSQDQDCMMDQGAAGNTLFVGVTERGDFTNMRLPTNSPQPVSVPGQSSSLRIDLNASPRDFSGEDHYASSPIYGYGASTLSGRRHIHQRIRILLSNNRPRENFTGINMHSSVTDSITSEGAWVENTLHASRGALEHQQDCRPTLPSNATMVPCMLKEGSSFRHVDGAKEQVQSMVLSYLQNYSRDAPLERTTFKEVGRKSTHTILAACGIEHQMDMVSADVEPPNDCAHDSGDGPVHLAKGCCLSCFNSFVKDLVLRVVNSSS